MKVSCYLQVTESVGICNNLSSIFQEECLFKRLDVIYTLVVPLIGTTRVI
nr:MAG TPA: hypothetical protein [Caudoviricetes sp.]